MFYSVDKSVVNLKNELEKINNDQQLVPVNKYDLEKIILSYEFLKEQYEYLKNKK